MRKIRLSQYAKEIGVCYKTAYNYYLKGQIKTEQLESGTILVLLDDEKKINDTKVVLYSRVSSNENKDNLDNQLDRIRNYAFAKGYKVVKEVKEIGSGLNDKRKKLEYLLQNCSEWDKIIVEHKDRFSRFGNNYIFLLLKQLGKEVEVINSVDNNSKDDLMQDFVSIITSFTARLYGLRRSKRKTEKIIKELQNEK